MSASNPANNTSDKYTKYPLYVLTSSKDDLYDDVVETVQKHGDGNAVSPIHVMFRYFRGGHKSPTSTNFFLANRKAYAAMKSDSDFPYQIDTYRLNTRRDYVPENCRTMRVVIPNGKSADWAKSGIHKVMDILIKFGVLPTKSYTVRVPLKDRITGSHIGKALIEFKEDVDIDPEAMIISMVYLHQMFWHLESKREVVDRRDSSRTIEVRNHTMEVEWDVPRRPKPAREPTEDKPTRKPTGKAPRKGNKPVKNASGPKAKLINAQQQ